MKMFGTEKLKLEIKTLQALYLELEDKYNKLREIVNSQEWLDSWHQYLANREVANESMQFQLTSKTDTQLLEKVIQECNKDPDLAVILRTADGTTLTLRSYPVQLNNKIKSAMSRFDNNKEEEKIK